jgi:hypothetical protein
MAIHTLTNGERYKIGKVNNTAVILESTDEAGSAYTLRPTQFICETSASVKINLQGSNNSGVPVLWLNNTFNGTNSDCFIRFDSTWGFTPGWLELIAPLNHLLLIWIMLLMHQHHSL